ncbi:CBL-interacting serine/threonine-protein kinase 9 [Stylosanthes scabra]|uniref:non-specific serine/threonine protein kinase n=1 Tax=Stylosanthes scabra TaxID=79078 RepID=A0ABU6ZMW5_9FABA|nr:CBL-interacting serine/threonine-protein kinase 9 [Stylosanthes scabra]
MSSNKKVAGGGGRGAPPPPKAVARTCVGKYELGKTIGEGSFAKVKFAKNVENGNHVAIKILDKSHVLKHKMIEQLKKEISAMKLIKHPNVVRMFEVMASKTKIYIVLELVNGGELFDKIARYGRLKEDEARSYFQQLINAVDYCHSRGVYHRDLKPENLLLDSNGVLKVSDFGLSTYAQRVINDRGYVGSASDIWSCGVILFVLMAGYLPFDEPNQMTLYKKIEKAQFTCPSWFSPQAKKLLKRILDPNPLTRIKIPELLKDEWFRKGYKPPSFTEEEDVNVDDVAAAFDDSKENLVTERKEKPVSMNAFELISRSQSFNLDSLFEQQTGIVKRETHFASQHPPNEIMSKIEEAAKPLGFNVRKRDYKMKLQGDKSGRKGHLSVATEVFEVAPSLHMVELRKTGGDTLEFHKFYKNFSSGLQDIVWHTEEKV